ncbi:SDR family NAD(P)-dependent oxidoreductase, partial [Burkholderia pseudomallei]|uniref:SDR family NAD(P)-dependent oxidoreductase n=1 Tax=Burkholderia pseudomallei TaxID=28450 RepID=UPI0011776F93
MNTHHAPGRFSGKVTIVTGAAQGIGRGVARRAAREGATAVLVDRADLVHEAAADIVTAGGRAPPPRPRPRTPRGGAARG